MLSGGGGVVGSGGMLTFTFVVFVLGPDVLLLGVPPPPPLLLLAAFAHGFFHKRAGMGAGAVKTQGGQGINLTLHLRNAYFQCIEAVKW